MTDQTQSAVEVMARAFVRAKGNDPDAELKLCGVGPRRPAWQHIEGPIHEALDALLGHLAAHGGQIVPKSFPQYREENGVAWQDEKLLEVIEQADEAYRKAQVHSIGGQTVDAAWGRQYGRMLAAVRVLLAAAPGWQIVPKVATGRMVVAGLEHGGIGAGLAYDDMLAAAPQFPGSEE